MKRVSTLIVFVFLSFFALNVKAQRGQLDYALGVRLGLGMGITVQHFITDTHVIEGIFSARFQGVSLTGLYEMHTQIKDFKGLKYYFGFGGHFGTYNPSMARFDGTGGVIGARFQSGGDGILGLEYFMRSVPIQISIDWKPEYNLVGLRGFTTDNGAISIRYRL